ncbi:MAG: acylphosphatase [Bacteroidota bacterium]|nr:acylphosphatase [Bacteroidota bacterium]
MPTLHLLIKGKVQGVFFRASAKEVADRLGITGWIKNTDPGDVEAVLAGSETQLTVFLSWCRQGPRGATVSEVISTEEKDCSFEHFAVIR